MAANTSTVILGAGKWYATPWSSGAINITNVAVDANLIGYTQGGATITYTPETYTIEDDIGMVRKTFVTKGSATMKTGLLTFDLASLQALQSVGTWDNSTKTLKLPGGKSSLSKMSIVFVYEDDDTHVKTSVGMIGVNASPLELAFAKDKETVVELEFTSESNGVDDTIVTIVETAPASTTT